MIETQPKFGWIYHVLRVILQPFTRRVKHVEGVEQHLTSVAQRGQIVYVGRAASFIEWLVIAEVLRKHSLPTPTCVNGVNPLLWMPLSRALPLVFSRIFQSEERIGKDEVRDLLQAIDEGQHVLTFLKVRRGWFQDADYHYEGLFGQIATTRSRRRAPTYMLPTSVFLTRKRKNTERTLRDIFFGTYDVPGRFRTLAQLILSGSKGIVLFSREIDLDAEMERLGERELGEVALEKKLRWTLLFHLNNEDRAYRGPNKRSTGRKVRRILKEKRLRAELAKVAERQNRSFESVLKEADKDLHDITSDTSEKMINFLRLIFDFVWARTLEGIDFKPSDFNRMRELSKQGPVVFLPCHRSHADYLVFAYMFEKQGMNNPRFAAGDNLSKWPLGMFFRRAGAFFIRRTFKGEPIFPLVFDAYIRHILRDRHLIAFFMEGGRSRTGKLLHPKVGMLGMILDAWTKGVVEDVPLVPITIDYGRVFEGASYLSEMSGQEKQKENLRSLLRTPKFLRKKHGIIRIRFNDPISLRQFVADNDLGPEDIGFRNKLPLLHALGHRVMQQINQSVTITAANVLAGILMGNPRRGLTDVEIRALFVLSVRYLDRRGVELAFQEKSLDLALENATQTFQEWETIVSVKVAGQTIINIPPAKRPEMEYYKNNGLHFMLDLALVASAVKCLREPFEDQITGLASEIFELLQLEFVMPEGYPSEELLKNAIQNFVDMGALKREAGYLRRGADPIGRLAFDVCSHLLVNLMESYFAVAEYLLSDLKSENTTTKDALKGMIDRAELLYAVGTIQKRESINKVTFDLAIGRFNKMSYIQLRTPKGQKHPSISLNTQKTAEFRALREKLLQWIQAID
ncbi:MAG: 1-acyl-sn-glycerol-3-phosphate acyltransferase [Acidobacteria bacterium]|nr:1-acyl-sn-glycerol-3-phosphate acyltransferase [Acidobacteriota bacterium]